MIITRRVASSAIALAIAAVAVSGCAGPVQSSGPASTPSVAAPATASVPATSTTTAAPAQAPSSGPAGGLSAADLERMRKQLDAMQREINSLKMPSDDDFNSAASELY